jgi:hypothetical protein
MPTMTIALIWSFCCCFGQETLKPGGLEEQKTVSIEIGELKAVIVNNDSFGSEHRAGYNGIAELYHSQQDSTLFVPLYAGFNLEHIFGGDSLESLFEPRQHHMSLYQTSENSVLLYQSPTPLSQVESLTEFRFLTPHYIDVTFKCRHTSDQFFKNNYAGLFWASYIYAPDDKMIYFKGRTPEVDSALWIGAYSERHGEKSTHTGIDERYDIYFAPNFNARLANHFSGYRFIEPFYFGRFHNMVLAYMFDTDQVIRFSQSPTGGGQGNPAWDFQFLIPNPIVGKIYTYRARVVYKPFVSREDVAEEYRFWKRGN